MRICFLLTVWAATFAGSPTATAQIEVPAAEARLRENGRITREGAFSFWEQGSIGDRFLRNADGTAELRFTAQGVAVDGEWPLVAIELTQAESGTRDVARISVSSSTLREFRREIELPLTPFELRLHQLNRSTGPERPALRHLTLTRFSLDKVKRFDGLLLEDALFRNEGTAKTGPPRSLRTEHLEAEVWPESGMWRVADAGRGCRLDAVHPALLVDGQIVDLESYRAECAIAEDVGAIIGPATRVAVRYRKSGSFEIDYTLWFSRSGHDVVAQVDFSNDTGGKVVVGWTAPLVCPAASLGGNVSSWAAVGDAKANSGAPQRVDCGALRGIETWWHVAIKNRATSHGLLAGSLTNRKGLGRFLLARRDEQTLRLVGYSDYERIEMPSGARIEGEPFLLCFGRTGNAALERFGELVGRANGIDLRRDHPLDTHTPRGLALFTSLNQWGASVLTGFDYQFDHSKGEHALMDPAWAALNQQQLETLGLDKFGYGMGRTFAGVFAAPVPLARRYGTPDFWSKTGTEVLQQHPDYYREGKLDFSNPAVQELERQRVKQAFAQTQSTVTYSWDFTDRWHRLAGQYDPFMTSADTYRAAMGIWREAARSHPAGAYACLWMNVVGLNYGLADVIHIGHDSDKGYRGEGLTFTHGLTRQISGRYFYNGRVWWNSPDSFHVYGGGVYSAQEAKVHASFASIAGNVVHLGEPLGHQQTPPDRVEIIRRVSPTTADVARAVDVFENNPARLWAMPVKRSFGCWTVAGLFNVDFDGKGLPITHEVRFSDIDLDPAKEYLVYEFWSRKFLGAVRGGFTRTLPAVDCEVYAIVESQGRPTLLSTSRHVRQMAFDILDCQWIAPKRTLIGKSLVVDGDPYQLRIHVPPTFLPQVAIVAGAPAKTATKDAILEVDFPTGAAGETTWEVMFEPVSETPGGRADNGKMDR